mmetsp:Transcript_31254/g.54284  ORF Transcript_31254/g.54284 Transcript_31254/m.54284 type:complete len:82 (-) Transcript_31254:1369-1614(-)
MIVSEFRPAFIVKHWSFLVGTFGKGLFYIFVGTLCIRSGLFVQYIMAAICVAVGVFILCCKTVTGEPTGSDPPEPARASQV